MCRWNEPQQRHYFTCRFEEDLVFFPNGTCMAFLVQTEELQLNLPCSTVMPQWAYKWNIPPCQVSMPHDLSQNSTAPWCWLTSSHIHIHSIHARTLTHNHSWAVGHRQEGSLTNTDMYTTTKFWLSFSFLSMLNKQTQLSYALYSGAGLCVCVCFNLNGFQVPSSAMSVSFFTPLI